MTTWFPRHLRPTRINATATVAFLLSQRSRAGPYNHLGTRRDGQRRAGRCCLHPRCRPRPLPDPSQIVHPAAPRGRQRPGHRPSNAIIIADTDAHVFSLWHVRYVETTQPAPVIVAKDLFHYQWYQDTLQWHEPEIFLPTSQGDTHADLFAFLDANLPRRPIYLTDYDERILARYAHDRQGSRYKLGVKG